MSDIVYGKERRIGVSVDAYADILKERDALRASCDRLETALNEKCDEAERLRAALIHARNQMQHPDQLIDEALEGK